MQALQDLAMFFLLSQFLSAFMLVLGIQFDEGSFVSAGINKHRSIPGLIKSARLFGQSSRPLFMAIYLLSLIFVLFSYAALLVLIGQFLFLSFR